MLISVSDVQDTDAPQSGLDAALSDESYDQWVSRYGMRERVACTPDLREDLKEPRVKCQFKSWSTCTDTGIHRKQDIYSMHTWVRCM